MATRTFTNKYGVAVLSRPDYGKFWASTREKRRKSVGKVCQACGATLTGLELHHIVPLSKGGTNNPMNTIQLCEKCHSKRHKHMTKRRR